MVIRSVGVASCARLVASIYAMFGLLAGFFLTALTLLGFDVAGSSSPELAGWAKPLIGAGAVMVLPVVYAVMGWIGGGIGAWVFNRAARVMGGLEIELEQGRG